MICERWAVVAVPFPFLERPATKRRPALVLSADAFSRDNGHAILAMVTTAKHSAWPSDYPIRDHEEAGLPVPSIIRWKVFTLANVVVERQLGMLGAEDRNAVAHAARLIFAWP